MKCTLSGLADGPGLGGGAAALEGRDAEQRDIKEQEERGLRSLLALAKCKGVRTRSTSPEERACKVGTEHQSSATQRQVMKKTEPGSSLRCTVQGREAVGTSNWLYGGKLRLVIWGEENSP